MSWLNKNCLKVVGGAFILLGLFYAVDAMIIYSFLTVLKAILLIPVGAGLLLNAPFARALGVGVIVWLLLPIECLIYGGIAWDLNSFVLSTLLGVVGLILLLSSPASRLAPFTPKSKVLMAVACIISLVIVPAVLSLPVWLSGDSVFNTSRIGEMAVPEQDVHAWNVAQFDNFVFALPPGYRVSRFTFSGAGRSGYIYFLNPETGRKFEIKSPSQMRWLKETFSSASSGARDYKLVDNIYSSSSYLPARTRYDSRWTQYQRFETGVVKGFVFSDENYYAAWVPIFTLDGREIFELSFDKEATAEDVAEVLAGISLAQSPVSENEMITQGAALTAEGNYIGAQFAYLSAWYQAPANPDNIVAVHEAIYHSLKSADLETAQRILSSTTVFLEDVLRKHPGHSKAANLLEQVAAKLGE